MTDEVWKTIPGFEAEVSNLGRARSKTRTVRYIDGRVAVIKGRDLKASRGSNGYRSITLGAARRLLLHRAVAMCFLGPQPDWADCINHKNGDKLDNSAGNLEWASYAQNNHHARQTGLQNQKGENCNLTKYSDQLVDAVRKVHRKYMPTYVELADLFNISQTTAAQIVKRQSRV